MIAAPLTPRARAKRERIHQAAQTLFMQQGFEAASMEAIAEAAAVSKPTLYRYYQSKEALFITVLEHLAVHQLSENALLVFRDKPMDSLATLEQALTVWAQETIKNLLHPVYVGLLRLLIAELPRFPSLGALFAQAVPQQGGAFLKTLLENARQHGVIVVTDLEPAIRLLAGSLLTYVLGDGLLAPAPLLQTPPPEQIDALVRLALHGVASPQAKEAH